MKIPPKNRPEWQALLTGQINVPLKNFFFQMKITQAKNQVAKNKISLDEAVDELYELCVKFSKAKYMDTDIQNIFYANYIPNQTHHDKTDNVVEQDEPVSTEKGSKIDKLERIRLQEQEAKFRQQKLDDEQLSNIYNSEEKPQEVQNSQIDRIKMEAQRAIQRRYELEMEKRRAEKQIKDNQTTDSTSGDLAGNEDDNMPALLKEEMELLQIEKLKAKKRGGIRSFFKNLFGNG